MGWMRRLLGSGKRAASDGGVMPTATDARVMVLVEEAVQARSTGDLNKTIQLFDQVLALDPLQSSVWNDRGMSLLAVCRPAEAITSFERALAIRNDDPDLWNNKGMTLAKMGLHTDARDCFDKATGLAPSHEKAWYNKSLCLIDLNDHAAALACLDRALKLKPDYDKALYKKGWILANHHKQYKQALKSFKAADRLGYAPARKAVMQCEQVLAAK
jgi:tetratricopeptide (TPR) repeat protein